MEHPSRGLPSVACLSFSYISTDEQLDNALSLLVGIEQRMDIAFCLHYCTCTLIRLALALLTREWLVMWMVGMKIPPALTALRPESNHGPLQLVVQSVDGLDDLNCVRASSGNGC